MRNLLLLILGGYLVACTFIAPPARFPQLNERPLTRRGRHRHPQWSPEGTHLAFFSDQYLGEDLIVYDLQTRLSWIAAFDIYGAYAWTPTGQISYVDYRPELSGTPCPRVHDLHIVDRYGNHDQVVVTDLYSPYTIVWLANGHQFFASLSTGSSRCEGNDIYLVDITTGTKELFISRAALNVGSIGTFALSADETTLAIEAYRQRSPESEVYSKNQEVIIIFDLGTHAITKEIIPDQEIPFLATDPKLPQPSTTGEHLQWIGEYAWLLDKGYAAEGPCYNYNLFFLNIAHPADSFCIPSSRGIIAEPAISPDLSQIAYITMLGPGVDYVMLAELTSEYRTHIVP